MRGDNGLAILVAMAVLAGCQGQPTDAGPSTSQTSSSEVEGSVDSTTTTMTSEGGVPYRLYEPGTSPSEDAGVSGHLRLRSCRWRGPGIVTFDLRWTPSEEASSPVTIPISLTLGTDDVGQTYLVDVVLSEAGDFSIDFDSYDADARQVTPPTPRRWQASRGVGDGLDWCTVDWFSNGRFRSGSFLDVEVDVDRRPSPSTVPGGLEEVVAEIDPTDRGAPLLPLVSLFSHDDLPAIDLLYIHPTSPLQHISVGQEGSCVSIESDYSELGLFLSQRVGCPRGQEDLEPETLLLADDIWEVTVTGIGIDPAGFADEIEAIPLLAVEPFTAERARVDPDSVIDAMMSERDLHLEVARLAWSGGKIAVVRGVSGTPCCETYMDSIVVTPEQFNPNGTGVDCRDYSQVILSDDRRAFLLVVTRSPGYHVHAVTDGQAREVPLQPALGNREVGLLDLTGATQPETTQVTVTDPSGTAIACIQE